MSKNELYLKEGGGQGRWAISRLVEGRWIHLLEDSPLEHQGDAEAILQALSFALRECLDVYFPQVSGLGRCPTRQLLELCSILDPTNPIFDRKEEDKKKQIGV